MVAPRLRAGPGGIGRFVALGQVKNSGASGDVSLSTLAGERDLSTIPTSTGTYAATVGFTSHFELWYRDVVGAGHNFSNSFSITWRWRAARGHLVGAAGRGRWSRVRRAPMDTLLR